MTPDVRVVRGEPDDVELAALVAGLAATAAAEPSEHVHAPTSPADDAARRWRAGVQPAAGGPVPGPDAWRWSGRG